MATTSDAPDPAGALVIACLAIDSALRRNRPGAFAPAEPPKSPTPQ